MNDTGTIYITIGLLYNLSGTLFIGLAMASYWSGQHQSPAQGEAHRDAKSLVMETRCLADSMMGILMFFFGFALQALGHNVEAANSFITYILLSTLFFILLLHSIYIREVLADECAESKAREIKQTIKNNAYFGQS